MNYARKKEITDIIVGNYFKVIGKDERDVYSVDSAWLGVFNTSFTFARISFYLFLSVYNAALFSSAALIMLSSFELYILFSTLKKLGVI